MIEKGLVLGLRTEQEMLSEREGALKQLKIDFDKKHSDLIESIASLKASITINKGAIMEQAMNEYKQTGEKKLLGGIGIREKNVISYDSKEALDFAKKKDLFLTLDKKAFDKAAPSLGLDFVTVERIPQITFPAVIKEVE